MLLSVKEGPVHKLLLADARHESESLLQSFSFVAIADKNELISCGIEHVEDIVVDLLKLLN
jgi:hypothetical protein